MRRENFEEEWRDRIPEEDKVVYCAFTGLGKTYFCQHNLCWVDLDESLFFFDFPLPSLGRFFTNYIEHGYKILTNATSSMMHKLRSCGFKLKVFLPEDNAETKEWVLEGIKGRKENQHYHGWLSSNNNYERVLFQAQHELTADDEITYIPAGKHLSDYLK